MLSAIHPKLPMRDKQVTQAFYVNQLGFTVSGDYPDYLIVGRDEVEIHFFRFPGLDPLQNYGQVYIRTNNIDAVYGSFLGAGTRIHPGGELAVKPWQQKEFSVIDPDHNLLTFGQAL